MIKSFYLDTSAINSLYDDPKASKLIEAIKKNAYVYVSIFTIAEIAAESNAHRRIGLIKIVKDMISGYRPAAMPADILRRSLEAISMWAPTMNHSMGSQWNGVWIALNDPGLINCRGYQEVTSWKQQQEKWYQDMHNKGRPEVQRILAKLPPKERLDLASQFSRFLKYYLSHPNFVEELVNYIASRTSANVKIDDELVRRIIRHSEYWRFFLLGHAYGVHALSVRMSHFAKDKNPGSIDTQQSIYLAICDVFVTSDQQQHRMLRLLTPFGHKKRQVWKYSKFASWLLNRAAAGRS
jgi:uncharacterized protein with PIN domain